MKHYLYILFIIPFLSSCYNVNSYSNYVNNETYTLAKEPKVIKEQKTLKTDSVFTCGIYIPLPSKVMPEIPIDVIKSLKNKSDKEIQSILTAHIKELREYTKNKKEEDTEHYQKYLDSCTHALK